MAARLHYSVNNQKDEQIESIKDAYAISEKILNELSDIDKGLYIIK